MISGEGPLRSVAGPCTSWHALVEEHPTTIIRQFCGSQICKRITDVVSQLLQIVPAAMPKMDPAFSASEPLHHSSQLDFRTG